MSWTAVGRALVGSWPSQVAAWGADAIEAYIAELQARGVTPDMALLAIRSCPPDQKFPPNAPELAGIAHRDPSKPTYTECERLIRWILRARPAESTWPDPPAMERAYHQARLARAQQVHPLVGSFVIRFGMDRLREMPIDDPDVGHFRRRELQDAWAAHVEAFEGRELAAIAVGEPRRRLGRLDPLRALGIAPPARAELEAGDE